MKILILLLATQDLMERARQAARPDTRVSPDRLDLRIGPRPDRASAVRAGSVGLNLEFMPDLACGTFDLGASFKSVFNKSVRDEMLNDLIKEAQSRLASSAMVLACQMSPTVCDAIKHYRVTAQEFLQMDLDSCRAIEQRTGGTERELRAGAIKECLERHQAQGMTLDEAMRLCRGAQDLRGLRGQRVQEIDLVKEVGDALGLQGEPRRLLGQFLNRVTMSTTRFSGNVKVRAIDEMYIQKRRDRTQALGAAVEAARRGVVPPSTLDRLAPPGTPPITNNELQRLASMKGVDRELVISMLASALALAEVVREAGDVQAALASARAMSNDPTLREVIERESSRIDEEVRRLKDSFETDALVTQARLRADSASAGQEMYRARQNTAGWRERDRQSAATQATREWGKSCPTSGK